MKKLISHIFLFISFISIYPSLSFAQDEDSAVIIMYHRFGEGNFPSTNVTLDQIDQHIEELSKDIYNVVPLRTIVEAFENGTLLPPRTVAITVDDAYRSIYEEAYPRFKAANIPFTVFVPTEPISGESENSMTWDHVREMAADPLVDIGHHGHAHAHLTEIGISNALADIEFADNIYRQELGYIPDLIAFPYGEYSQKLIDSISDRGFKAGFAQYSSAASSRNNSLAIPRFAFNENYSDIERFRLVVNSRALPVRDILPKDPNLEQNPPAVGFTVDESIEGLSAIGCFPSHMSDPASVNRIGNNRIEVRFAEAFPTGRSRVNCTMPGPDGRWYWLGIPIFNLNNPD